MIAYNIDLRGFVARQFFVANLRTFLAYNLQAKKCGGVQKMTNIRYEVHEHIYEEMRFVYLCIHGRKKQESLIFGTVFSLAVPIFANTHGYCFG